MGRFQSHTLKRTVPTPTTIERMAATMTAPKKMLPLSAKPPVSSTPVQALSGIAARMASAKPAEKPVEAKGRCEKCQREIKQATLDRNGGHYCLTCKKALEKEASGIKPVAKRSQKAMCQGTCNKEYTQATLTKHKINGKASMMCKRCTEAAVNGPAAPEEDVACRTCRKPTNPTTAAKYYGLCHPCVRAQCKAWFEQEMLAEEARKAQPQQE